MMPNASSLKVNITPHALDVRRGPGGRWLIVPKGVSHDPAELGAETYAIGGVFDGVREIHREYKLEQYEAKKNDPTYHGPRIVAEGDSWFEYPWTTDLIMCLEERFAILSLARAGDSWADVYQENELFPAINAEHPDIVMLSLGGNEVIGNIETFAYPYQPNRKRDQYIKPNFQKRLDWLETQFNTTIMQILASNARVILHGYDYPDPRPWNEGGQWIGGPLENDLTIADQTLWRQIANTMLDQFNARLAKLASKPEYKGRVSYVNLLGTIGTANYNKAPDRTLWNDEIHGSDIGFGKLAEKLAKAIKKILAVA